MSPDTSTSRSSSHSRRHSRRSTSGSINFLQMSVSPLTSASITEQDFTTSRQLKRRSASYIQGISAPSTPGILSRTPSYHRHHHHSRSSPTIPKSKSSSHIGSQEWMHRTGAALTLEARESKGQSWLGTRESSTSLVRLDADDSDDSDDNNTAGEHHHPASMSPMWVRGVEHDYMDAGLLHAAAAGILRTSDTVDKDSSSDEDDDEVDFRGGVFGIGQFIDRVIGWSVFADEETESEGEGEAGEERKKKRERIRLAPMEEEKLAEVRERREQDEGWQDPAWIFSVASSILF